MDKRAIATAFDLYAPAIYSYVFRLCANARMADEVVEAVFARLLEQLSSGRGPNSNLRSYLFEIAYQLIVDEIQLARLATPLEGKGWMAPDQNPISFPVEKRIAGEAVLRAIRNDLTEDQKHVIILRFLAGFSVKETAWIMKKTVSNVKVLQFRAIAALRNVLDDSTVDYKVVLREALI